MRALLFGTALLICTCMFPHFSALFAASPAPHYYNAALERSAALYVSEPESIGLSEPSWSLKNDQPPIANCADVVSRIGDISQMPLDMTSRVSVETCTTLDYLKHYARSAAKPPPEPIEILQRVVDTLPANQLGSWTLHLHKVGQSHQEHTLSESLESAEWESSDTILKAKIDGLEFRLSALAWFNDQRDASDKLLMRFEESEIGNGNYQSLTLAVTFVSGMATHATTPDTVLLDEYYRSLQSETDDNE